MVIMILYQCILILLFISTGQTSTIGITTFVIIVLINVFIIIIIIIISLSSVETTPESIKGADSYVFKQVSARDTKGIFIINHYRQSLSSSHYHHYNHYNHYLEMIDLKLHVVNPPGWCQGTTTNYYNHYYY